MNQLKDIYPAGEASSILYMVFEEMASIPREEIIRDGSNNLEDDKAKKLKAALSELATGKPVQYVIGHAWFCGMKFKVNENVLIPRPETEELVEHVIKMQPSPRKILDIGTGSGCIPIAIKKNLSGAEVHSMDISIGALELAKENAQMNGVEIKFIHDDILKAIPHKESYDVIVSNPPYIPVSEKEKLHKNVTEFEPHLALFVEDNDPLIFYKKIAKYASEALTPGGKLLVEIHQELSDGVVNIFMENGFAAEVMNDQFGNARFVIGTPFKK